MAAEEYLTHFLQLDREEISKLNISSTKCNKANTIGQLPRVSGEDPERIRVDSVVETFVCLFVLCSLSANFLIFPSFILLFLYSTVQKSAVQYSIRPPGRSEQR